MGKETDKVAKISSKVLLGQSTRALKSQTDVCSLLTCELGYKRALTGVIRAQEGPVML